jgi:hypothetical protein
MKTTFISLATTTTTTPPTRTRTPMPIIVKEKDIQFNENESTAFVIVPLNGANPSKASIFATDVFIKVSNDFVFGWCVAVCVRTHASI